jgi:hypothetical protein
MNAYLIFSITLVAIVAIIVFLDRKFQLLRDISTASVKPYSLSKVQLTWWTVIIFSSVATILFKRGVFPTFDQSTLILLGISSATAAAARVVDLSDQNNLAVPRHQDSEKQSFFLDILSDESGASIHRLQAVLFNLILGCWFVFQVMQNLTNSALDLNKIIPVVEGNNLIFLGISAASYVALKSTENKAQPATSAVSTPTIVMEETTTTKAQIQP